MEFGGFLNLNRRKGEVFVGRQEGLGEGEKENTEISQHL